MAAGQAEPIRIWDRAAGREIEERVYGGGALRRLYGTPWGRAIVGILARPWLSRLAGAYHDSPVSRRRIGPFVRAFGIRMDEFESGPFESFNAFFARAFRAGVRPFDSEPDVLPAFAEARYLALAEVAEATTFPVKGRHLTAAAVVGDASLAAPFARGPLLLARLSPVDYHRFHYPDDGRTLATRRISGALHSVNPYAVERVPDVFCTNARRASVLETEHFGRLLYVEVGAMNVGRIVQTHSEDRPFRRGDEKGRFLFGASSVLLFGERGKWTPEADLLERTAAGRETLVRLGRAVGARRKP